MASPSIPSVENTDDDEDDDDELKVIHSGTTTCASEEESEVEIKVRRYDIVFPLNDLLKTSV